MEILHELKHWLNPHTIIEQGGVIMLLAIIFAETGLFFGFFLPGDSLLFVGGLAISTGLIHFNLLLLIILTFAAAVTGNFVGFWFGWAMGPRLFRKDDSMIFKKRYLDMTQSFYDKHGRAALILGRFLPIIRTFVPILAGAIRLEKSRFTAYNIIGAALWVPTFIILGYFLGTIHWVEKNLEIIVIGLIVITILPVIRTFLKERARHLKKENSSVN